MPAPVCAKEFCSFDISTDFEKVRCRVGRLETVKLPETVNFSVGVVVPMLALPEFVILICSLSPAVPDVVVKNEIYPSPDPSASAFDCRIGI